MAHGDVRTGRQPTLVRDPRFTVDFVAETRALLSAIADMLLEVNIEELGINRMSEFIPIELQLSAVVLA